MRECHICKRLVNVGVLCSEHAQFAALGGLILAGAISDWPRPANPNAPKLPTHREFMTGEYTSHPAFTLHNQLTMILMEQRVWFDESGWE